MLVKSKDKADEMLDIGQVGEITRIDPAIIQVLDARDFIPVVAPLGADAAGNAYNINADVAAGKIAGALQAEKVIFMTNTPGVLDKQMRLLTGLTVREVRRADRRRHHFRRHDSQGRLRRRRGQQRGQERAHHRRPG